MASQLTIDTLGDAVTRALGSRLVSLLLYGSAARGTHVPKRSDVNTLLVCATVDGALFDALAPVVRAWTKSGHPAPLIFTEREWRESADAFPIEYEDMREAHRLLAGRDPWSGIRGDRGGPRRPPPPARAGAEGQGGRVAPGVRRLGGRAETPGGRDRRERAGLFHHAARPGAAPRAAPCGSPPRGDG